MLARMLRAAPRPPQQQQRLARWPVIASAPRGFATAAVSRHRSIALAREAAAPVQAARCMGAAAASPREAWLERSLEDGDSSAIVR